jgi:hypothetical protein
VIADLGAMWSLACSVSKRDGSIGSAGVCVRASRCARDSEIDERREARGGWVGGWVGEVVGERTCERVCMLVSERMRQLEVDITNNAGLMAPMFTARTSVLNNFIIYNRYVHPPHL